MHLQYLSKDPVFFFSVVVVVMLSTVLHELGHAYAAIYEGDDTPRALGHITLNPMVHMGPLSLASLFIVGISWGQCPVNPRRFRHKRWGDALVSFAGPATNAALCVLFAIAFRAWSASGISLDYNPAFDENVARFLRVGVRMNAVLAMFNLLPLPPLDGYTVASLIPGFRDAAGFLERNAMMGLFVAVLVAERTVFPIASEISMFLLS